MTYEDTQEYGKFILKFTKSVNDLKSDYDKLSENNKIKFKSEVKKIFPEGIIDIINFLNSKDSERLYSQVKI